MKFGRIISAVAVLAMSVSVFAVLATTASAAVDTEIKYLKDGVEFTEYQYAKATKQDDKNPEVLDTLTLDKASKEAIENAPEGSTLTITYNLISAGTNCNRAGLALWQNNKIDKIFYANAHKETSVGNWNKAGNNANYINGDFEIAADPTAEVTAAIKYIFTLDSTGKMSRIDKMLTDSTGKEISKYIEFGTLRDISTLKLVTSARCSGTCTSHTVSDKGLTLTNFEAVLTEPLDVWQFKGLDTEKWNTGLLKFDYTVDGVEGTTTTNGIVVSDFISKYASDKATYFSGDSTINFGIVVIEDVEDTRLTRVYIEEAEDEIITLATGDFEADAEIDESEYLEIGSSDFDIE